MTEDQTSSKRRLPERRSTHQRIGTQIIYALCALIRAAEIYQPNNEVFKRTLRAVIRGIHQFLMRQDRLQIRAFKDSLYVNEDRIYIEQKYFGQFNKFTQQLAAREIGGLEFEESPSMAHLASFILRFCAAAKEEDPALFLEEGLTEEKITSISILPLVAEIRSGDELVEDRVERSRKTYFYSVAMIKGLAEDPKEGSKNLLRKARRLVKNMVDLSVEDMDMMLGLATLKNYDQYTYSHSVNVAILGITIAKAIGLNKSAMLEVGLGGLFHDVGKILVPTEILNKKGPLTPEEREVMKTHSIQGVKSLLDLTQLNKFSSRIILCALEHHIRYDMRGYPDLLSKQEVTMHGRIIAIADVYDAITSPRVYRPVPMSPAKAIALILSHAGKEFDAVLAKVFANMLGPFPIGSLVSLNTGEVGLVKGAPSPGGPWTRPLVLLLTDTEKKKLPHPIEVDLEAQDPSSDAYERSIVGVASPYSLKIDPAEYLVQ